ncbi:MAG: hypothetical protein L6V89_05915 [Oscillospiraceae bacterium]|nr:MAG: hypothetical protein L6V89_05915 [Oscillospiraceae bacterium]
MNLFIGTGEPALKGWEGYEYVLNRASEGSVSRLSSDFSLTDAGKAEVSVQGKEMYITLSRELLGLTGEFRCISSWRIPWRSQRILRIIMYRGSRCPWGASASVTGENDGDCRKSAF